MAYNDSNRGKNRPAGSRGGVKKYPADRNFGGAERTSGGSDRKPFRGNRDGENKKPYYGNKPNADRKPYYGGKDNADRKPYYGGKDNADRKQYYGGKDNADRKQYYGGKDNADRKPYYGGKDNADRKPYYGAKDSAPRKPHAPKGGTGWEHKPRPDWKKPYDKIPPHDTAADRQETAAAAEDSQDTEDGEDYDPTAGLVIGRSAVRELLRSGRTVDKLLVHRGEREGSIVVLVAEAIEQGIPVVEVDKAKLDEMAGFVPHQGVIAMVAQKDYCSVEDILALAQERGEKPLIVIADGITDPYNLGALIRCAEGVGAHGLIIPRRRAVGLTALVAKSSAGAMEHLAVAKVSNIAATVKSLQQAGIWCYAAEAGGKPHYETDLTGPCALVFGSEGDGVSRVVRQACDGVISIPMYGKVNSFNVSTAAAVVLCEAARQQHSKGNAD